MNNSPYVTVKYAIFFFLLYAAFSENSNILIFFNCSVKKLHKHYENVRGSEPRGHTYARCVNHLEFKFFFVDAPEKFFYANKYILRYSSFKYIYICH